YSNAAHNPPLLWRAATNTVTRLDTVGMLLGLDIDTHYYEEQVELQPGDTILYYTDGFTDAANPKGERMDEDNLINALKWSCHNRNSAQEILEYLFEMLQRFVGRDRHTDDDVTLVVMRIKPELQLNLFDQTEQD
ncbi:MAG: PP2C family protein-serine/threonine phosphatase, partial [Cyanobacteria bacterium P01_E01_bin.43]